MLHSAWDWGYVFTEQILKKDRGEECGVEGKDKETEKELMKDGRCWEGRTRK